MFNLFGFGRKGTKAQLPLDDPRGESQDEEVVIVHIKFGGTEEFGTKDDQQHIYDIEDLLEEKLPADADVDDHEFGDGGANIYVYGKNATQTWAAMADVFQGYAFASVVVTLRHGALDDIDAQEEQIVL